MKSEDTNLLNIAIAYLKQDNQEKAIEILQNLLVKYPENKNVNGLLGSAFSVVQNYNMSKKYLEKSLRLKSNNELFHLGLYITYFETGNHDKAFKVIFDYLENNKANLFKDSLEELLDGLIDSYGEEYKNKIIYYSLKNKVNVPTKLLNRSN